MISLLPGLCPKTFGGHSFWQIVVKLCTCDWHQFVDTGAPFDLGVGILSPDIFSSQDLLERPDFLKRRHVSNRKWVQWTQIQWNHPPLDSDTVGPLKCSKYFFDMTHFTGYILSWTNMGENSTFPNSEKQGIPWSWILYFLDPMFVFTLLLWQLSEILCWRGALRH